MMLLYGFSSVYDKRPVPKSCFILPARRTILDKLLEICDNLGFNTSNMKYLVTLKKHAKKHPDKPAVLFKKKKYLVPIFAQLVEKTSVARSWRVSWAFHLFLRRVGACVAGDQPHGRPLDHSRCQHRSDVMSITCLPVQHSFDSFYILYITTV